MRIQFAIAALICVSSLAAFQAPVTAETFQEVNNNCSIYLIKIVADVNKLIPLVEAKEWVRALPIALDLGENLTAAYQCFHQHSIGFSANQIKETITGHCPYLECLHNHLAPAHVLGVEFVKLLVAGNKDGAKIILADVVKELNAATECGNK